MGVDVTHLAEEQREKTAWQRTPEELEAQDYIKMIVRGIRKLYVDTGRALEYSTELLNENEGVVTFANDLALDEEEYVLLYAQIEFYKRVQTDVNNIVGYTTDALTVTNADKPYAHLQDTIDNLEKERRIVYYKMIRFVL